MTEEETAPQDNGAPPQAASTAITAGPRTINKVVESLKRRARRLEYLGWLFLLAIIGALGTGGWLFYILPSVIAQQDVQIAELEKVLQEEGPKIGIRRQLVSSLLSGSRNRALRTARKHQVHARPVRFPTLGDAQFVSKDRGWAVGSRGAILATEDGGKSWTTQNSGTTATLNAIRFIDAKNGWVAGSRGMILATKDAGKTWTKQTTGTTNILYGVHFANAEKGWAVGSGGTILATSDGGKTWAKQTSGTTNSLYSVHFTSHEKGWATGSRGTILATSDGDKTWAKQTSGTTNHLLSVHFTSSEKGWATGSRGTILATRDGGKT